MTDPASVHRDRKRAQSFGSAAAQYDAHRPRYPAALIAELGATAGMRVLDVGAGTGIASAQLAATGVEVLAVEPDSDMARVAASKGIAVEVATFEQWDPAGRTFDLVVFAQSFHWVDPTTAFATIVELLAPDGRVALLWNRVVPAASSRERINEAYAGILDEWQRPSVDVEAADGLGPLLEAAGLVAERRTVTELLRYRTQEWVDLVTPYSNVLTLEPARQRELRDRLTECIGPGGVDAVNDALAVVCRRVT